MASIKVATSTKKRIRWDTEAKRKLIEIWAEILEKYDGKMMMRKNKEEMATKKLNVYVNTELSRAADYTTTEVHNKIDSPHEGHVHLHLKVGDFIANKYAFSL